VADPQVPPAACCIETESGKIYSDVEGRLDRIEEGLLKKAKENDVL
jgi:flagellar biosynthesis/type III secretory pathway protein FliH